LRAIGHFDWVILGSLTTAPVLSSLAVVADRRAPASGGHATFGFLMRRAQRLAGGRAPDERLARMLDRRSATRGVRGTAAVMARELRAALGVSDARVLVARRSGAFVDAHDNSIALAPRTLIARLVESSTPIDLSPQGRLVDLLPRGERIWAQAQNVGMIAPL